MARVCGSAHDRVLGMARVGGIDGTIGSSETSVRSAAQARWAKAKEKGKKERG